MTEATTQTEGQPPQTSGANDGSGQQPQHVAGSPGDAGQGGASARPEHIPESLWDAATGFKVDDAVKQLGELQAFKAGEESRRAAVPQKAEEYKLALPADFKAPDGMTFELDQNDPMFAFGRDVALALGADQPAFEKLVGMYAMSKISEAKEIEGLIAKQKEALGPKADDRIGAVKTYLSAKAGPDAPVVLASVLQLKAGVEIFERLMRDGVSGGAPAFSQSGRVSGSGSISDAEYEAMTPAQRLVHARKSSKA